MRKFTEMVLRGRHSREGISRVQSVETGTELLRLKEHATNLIVEARDVSRFIIHSNSSLFHTLAVNP
jgi:hypothetical protein